MKTIACFGLFAMAVCSPIRADLLTGCATCQGATYLLQYDPSHTTVVGPDTVYDLFLTIDTTNYNAGGSYLDNVLVKISNEVDLPPSQLLAAPGGILNWALTAGGLNAGGCQIGTDSGALCAQDGHTAPVPGHVYTWEFAYATTGALKTGPLDSVIKARYVDENGNKVGALVSQGITLGTVNHPSQVPEPASMLLLGSALVLAGLMRKRAVRT